MAFTKLFWISGACFHEPPIKYAWDWTAEMSGSGLLPQQDSLGKISKLSSALPEVVPSLPGRDKVEEIAKYKNFTYKCRQSLQNR